MEDEIVRSELIANRLSADPDSGSAGGTFSGACLSTVEEADPDRRRLLAAGFGLWIRESDFLGGWGGAAALYDGNGVRVAEAGADGAGAGLLQSLDLAAASSASDGREEMARYVAGEARRYWSLAVIPLSGGGSLPDAVFAAGFPDMEPEEAGSLARVSAGHLRGCLIRSMELELLGKLLAERRTSEKRAARRDLLLQTAKSLHNQIEVASVLAEILKRIDVLYPGARADLFLTQDYADVDPRVKPLILRSDQGSLCARAFLEGIARQESGAGGTMRAAVPLSGNQAIYGVLHLTLDADRWEEGDLDDFLALAETAGMAFENAKLYEQSNLLIQELRLINELTKRLNRSLRLKEIYKFTTDELLRVFGADFSCLLQFNREQGHFTVASCNVPEMASETFSAEYGFCGIVYRSKEPLIVSDYSEENSIPSKLMQFTDAKSLIASPILVEGEVAAVILVAHRNANFFSYDNYKLLQVLCTHIGLAVTNASLHAEVRRMVITDNLTGLHARHYLNEQIHQRQRKDVCGSLILVDIDYFKKVNDTFGHQIGDRILTQVSDVIRACIRDTDIAARWGGEELAVYLPKIRTEQAYRIADRIRMRVAAETNPTVTVSCGVSEWMLEDDKVSVESLFYRADMALYDAKHNGRNRVYVG